MMEDVFSHFAVALREMSGMGLNGLEKIFVLSSHREIHLE
jgi:hypothetical protein